MRGFNKVILAGNLTRDPELRYTPNGQAVAKFALAINRAWKDDTGQLKEEVTFVDIDAWGKQAETIGQYMKKGSPILVEGRLRLDQWEDKNTKEKRRALKVVLEGFTFLGDGQGSRDSGGGGGGGGEYTPRPQSRPAPSAPQPPAEPEAMPPEEDDVPF